MIPPRYRPAPITTAVSRPSTAPRPASSSFVDAWNAASRKTAVSSPSRSTAKNAIATSAQADPVAIAVAACASSSARSPRACRRIQTIMKVTIATAQRPTTVSSISCCRWGSSWLRICSATPTAAQNSDRDDHAEPDVAQRTGLALLAQERRDDADDQRRLEALAQADHVRSDHGAGPYQKLGHPN